MPPSTDKEWVVVPENRSAIEYSSLAGVPVYYPADGNATTNFTLESSHMFSAVNEGEPLTATTNVTGGFQGEQHPSNGTWRGYGFQNGDTQWGLATDRFVDPLWLTTPDYTVSSRSSHPNSPAIFTHESKISSRLSRILVQLVMPPGGNKSNRAFDQVEIICNITQQYIESYISCSKGNDQRLCRVIKQRASTREHAAESITYLSFPQVFDFVSRELPLATGRQALGFTDPSIYYLKDPMFEHMSNGTAVSIDEINIKNVGVRLGQLINTYLLLSQASETITNAGVAFESNITVEGESTTLVEIVVVRKLWVSLYLLSSIVLLAGGILSVIFAHLTYGPEILGYVSTTIRNSKFVSVPSETTWMDGPELAKEMKTLRIRYGLLEDTAGTSVLAVGREEETDRIRDVVKNRRVQSEEN
ncbi:hypothetical protein CGCS363_v003691 [Colletotrichum siamense]|uniref:uncharacterized protein n=1 Tax=Colletotrichum siamense TaxID=690259 RepID=UPI001873305C|nr:uncharacterized protein CGCS363_v003691 [Colletotrichum siamense]KAF5511566.1 hypothetical protein CGCS363_v003691 [Colletotrichum siamense]